MTIFIIQLLNSFFYAAVLFLIAAGLSLIYGVMRIVNLAHGTLYALGAYVSAWVVGGAVGHAASGTLGLAGLLLLLPVGAVAIAVVGAVIEPTLLRPLYRRPEEYHLLITFGLLMILEDAMKFLFGGTPLTAGSIMDHMGSIPIGRLLYPTYNLFVIAIGANVLIERFGGLDVLVNNAGVGVFADVADMSVASWQQVIETNLSGVFYCCHAAIPHLRRRGGGWIINISSLAG